MNIRIVVMANFRLCIVALGAFLISNGKRIGNVIIDLLTLFDTSSFSTWKLRIHSIIVHDNLRNFNSIFF